MPDPLTMVVGGFLTSQIAGVFSSMLPNVAAAQVNERLVEAFLQNKLNHDIQKALHESWERACTGIFAIYRDSPPYEKLPVDQQDLVNEREKEFVAPKTVNDLFSGQSSSLQQDDVARLFMIDHVVVNQQMISGLERLGLWEDLPGGLQSILKGHLLDALTFNFIEIAVKRSPEARDALFFEQFITLRQAAGKTEAEHEKLWTQVRDRLTDLDGYQRWHWEVLASVRETTLNIEAQVGHVSAQIGDLYAFLRERLDQAVSKQTVAVSEVERDQVTRRASRLEPVLHGARVLWVDDMPENNIYEREFLSGLGISITCVTTTAEALAKLSARSANYDIVISDIGRPDDDWTENPSGQDSRPAGLRLLQAVVKRQLRKPVIFYAWPVNEDSGVPPRAFGITDRPDELMHLVMDALERTRG